MPAVHQRVRRSARLSAITRGGHSRAMDVRPLILQGSEGNSRDHGPAVSAARVIVQSIQWKEEDSLTDTLVNFLSTHPADCHVLFYSNGKKLPSSTGDRPSGKDKNEVHVAIAKFIFEHHLKYGFSYLQNPKKFRDSVGNRISNLKGRYKLLKARFRTTGDGVVPGDGASILKEVTAKLQWYTELDAIWHANPAFSAKTISSQPGVDHAGDLYALVHRSDGAGSSTHFHGATDTISPPHGAYSAGVASLPPHDHVAYPASAAAEPSNHSYIASAQPHGAYFASTAAAPPHNHSTYPASAAAHPSNYSYPAGAQHPDHSYPAGTWSNIQPHVTHPYGAYLPGANNEPPIDPRLLQPAASPPHNAPPNLLDLPGANADTDNPPNFSDDNLYSDHVGPLAVPLGSVLPNHLEDDDHMMYDDAGARSPDMILNSPPKVIGKKRQPAASPSPSPPPDPHFPFTIPQKPPTTFYDSHAAFGAQRPSSRGAHRKPSSIASSGMSRSMSTPSSTTRNTSSESFMSRTPKTPSPVQSKNTGSGTKKKKAKSDIQQQVANINEDIEDMQSDHLSCQGSKHERFIAKLDAKRDCLRETKKYDWLRDSRSHEVMQADVNHKRVQEAKDAEIRLRQTDVLVHEAEAMAHEKEAETWRLKIQFHQMMQGSTSGSSASDRGQGN